MWKALLAAFALPFIVGVSASAVHAADVVIVDDNANVVVRDRPSARYMHRDRVVMSDGPVVYGWSFRPLDCGVYHYWNGTKCIDSRVVPPDVGPK